MKKLLIITILSMLFYQNSYCQETIRERKNAIGVSGGTGYGFDYSRKVSDRFFATIGYSSLKYSEEGLEQEISGQDLLIDAALDITRVDFKVSYHPFASAFKIVGGVGFFSSSNVNLKTTFKENIVIGEVEFNSEDSGAIAIDANWSKTSPYLGLGFGRPVSKKGIGFAFDFGTYISESPAITLDATGVIEQTNDQEALLNESFESFKFIPYASFRLSYSF